MVVLLFCLKPIELKKERNYAASCVAVQRAIYSASVVERATTDCLVDFQDIGLSLKTNVYSDVDFLEFISPPQSASL